MKNQKGEGAKLGFAALTLGLALLPACSAPVEGAGESEPGQVTEEIGFPTNPTIHNCQSRAPDAVILRQGETNGGGEARSPTKYGASGCEKSWVVDVNPNPIPKDADMNRVQWADQWNRNRAQCEGATLKVFVYSSAFDFMSGQATDLLYRYEGTVEVPLAWDAAHNTCRYGWINVYHYSANGNQPAGWMLDSLRDTFGGSEELSNVNIRSYYGRTLRLVASALAPGGNSTQPLWIWSYY